RDKDLRLSHALKANPTPSKQKESSSSKPTVGGNLFYQGIRATKSGGEKKFATRIAKHIRTDMRSENMVKKKVRSEMRPSEAANTVVRKHKLKIRDKDLRLSHALKANPTPSKQKESSSSKPAVGGNLFYQGIRATKSGGEKKFATRIPKHIRTDMRSENMVKKKVRSEMRPSVAAIKTVALNISKKAIHHKVIPKTRNQGNLDRCF
nr:RNA-binding protein 34 [Tanacetum cinerariifolium]